MRFEERAERLRLDAEMGGIERRRDRAELLVIRGDARSQRREGLAVGDAAGDELLFFEREVRSEVSREPVSQILQARTPRIAREDQRLMMLAREVDEARVSLHGVTGLRHSTDMATRTATRTETDTMGAIEVPADRYWGAQTQRSLENFKIGGQRFAPSVVHAFGIVKRAAANVNRGLGKLDARRAEVIAKAAEEVALGKLDDHFPLVVWQTGSGTQSNMNANEVIANRANELAGEKIVHPNDHVNMSQSSNDVFPTVMHVAVATRARTRLLPGVARLRKAIEDKAIAFADVVKIGRTHLMDATPLTLGQEMGGWAAQLGFAEKQITLALDGVHDLALGGTAVGTGLNSPPS